MLEAAYSGSGKVAEIRLLVVGRDVPLELLVALLLQLGRGDELLPGVVIVRVLLLPVAPIP